MTDKEYLFLQALENIGAELKAIKKILTTEKAPTTITFSKDGVLSEITDLESYFEALEDDKK